VAVAAEAATKSWMDDGHPARLSRIQIPTVAKAAITIAASFIFYDSRRTAVPRCPGEPNPAVQATSPEAYASTMDKKEIESPKLTENFLVWISAFVLLLFLLFAHFVWRVF
jgi:hypothetical protein